MENEAEGPKFDLWLPRCLFGFFLGIQKEARRHSGEIPPDPARKRHPTEPCCGGYRKGVGFPSPRLLRRSQRSRVVEATTHPAPPRNLCPTPHKGAPLAGGTTMLGNPPKQRQRWER